MKKITHLLVLLLAFNLGFGQTTLVKGDIAILGVNTDNEDFTFLLRTDITAGTTIYFSDELVNVSGTGLVGITEGVVLFTAATNYNCGTVIGYITNSSEFTSVNPGFILANGGDEVLAFQGYNSTTYEWTTFLHANIDGTPSSTWPGSFPVGFTAADIVIGNRDNRYFNLASNLPSWAEINDITNYNQGNSYSLVTLSTVSYGCLCRFTATWNGSWSGTPSSNTEVIIAADYTANSAATSFTACSLTVDTGFTLTVDNGAYIEVENYVTVDGNLIIETQGNFVQNDDLGTFTMNGLSRVNKLTATKQDWYYYTYWSSPVVGKTVGSAFPNTDGDRRFWFNAANYFDAGGNDIDDNGDDWTIAAGTDIMQPGVGYAATSGRFGLYPGADNASFDGAFNTGDISTGISYNAANIAGSWNFIGNPYPGAIDFDAFHAANSSVVDGAAYFWSQWSPPINGNPGNQQNNFSLNDYATYTVGSGGIAGASGEIPSQYVPSGQGFFITGLDNNTVTFTNAMRMADVTSNSQFYKNSNSKNKTTPLANRLWVNLTSDNGVFNQILIAYVDGATNGDDGSSYDAKRLLTVDFPAALYSTIESLDKKFAIQGKAINSLNVDEVIKLGFASNINVTTAFTLSIAQIEGNFLTSNSVFLKDNLLNTLHDLSTSDYTFTSEVGEFNDRFEIGFNAIALSTEDFEVNSKTLKIVELEDNHVQFTASMAIRNVKIFDLLGRQLYNFKGQSNSETYKLSKLSSSIYIAKVELSNGAIVTKKAFKK